MKRYTRMLFVFFVVMLVLLIGAPKLWAGFFTKTKIIIETNATAEDAGIQIFADADDPWKRLEIFDPNGVKIYDVRGTGSVGKQGVSEHFFESAEPSFDEQSLDELFDRFPAGTYTFKGTTVDGGTLTGKATLKHNIPAGPEIVFPPEGAALDSSKPIVIDWKAVTEEFPGTDLEIRIVGYQVIVERVKPEPVRIFEVNLRAAITKVTVPPEFLQGNADYIFEVLAIDASGNQTITEGAFTTK